MISTRKFGFKQTNKQQVCEVLEKLDANKATGYDAIPIKMMKIGASELAHPLSVIFNACIEEGKWPTEWKKGEWTPDFKRGDRCMKENYRPVTVLSCVDKVFEKLLAKQITINFEECLADGLTAYRKNNSCETTLVSLVESWRLAMDNRQCTSILSTDMSKAFDSLHPPLMLSKLKAYGFEDNAINLLRSYLCDRYNRVRMGSLTSSFRCTSRGCPQGSALGPLLWNIFQNDMTYNITSPLTMYADDHQIYEIGTDLQSVTTKLKESAALATEWYDSNLLEGNLKKYQTMNICSSGTNQYHTDVINIKNTEISPSNSLTLLGVTIDDKLSFRDHITTVCKKASQRIGVIMRLKNLIPTKAKLQLYKAAILPHLIFCHLV